MSKLEACAADVWKVAGKLTGDSFIVSKAAFLAGGVRVRYDIGEVCIIGRWLLGIPKLV